MGNSTPCRRLFAALPLFLLCLPMWAQLGSLEVGSVYHFVNKAYAQRAIAATSATLISGLATNADDYAQLWYVDSKTEAGQYKLRNLGTGRYMKSAGTSTPWTMVESAAETEGVYLLTVKETYNTLSATNSASGYDKAHCASSQDYKIVGWETSADATAWTITKKDISDAALQENWDRLASITPSEAQIAGYQTALGSLFADAACTTLKKSFASETALTADADYQALPATLQGMVRKVWSGNWEEANADASKEGWGSGYAQKYRVQLYEPYNNPGPAAEALGINAHTNLNNPTGLYTDRQQAAYIMVEGEIKDGARLYIDAYQGHDNPGHEVGGVELHTGLNVIPYYVDGNNLFVNYVVETFDTSRGKGNLAKARKLTDYAPLKIHIEGGHINGYWNRVGDALYTPDTNADWDYIEARATQTDVIVLGQYETLQFPLRDEDTVDNDGGTNKGLASFFNEQVKIEDCIAEWDNIVLQERLLMGLMSEADVNAANAKWQSRYPDADQPHGVYTYSGNGPDEADGHNYGSDYSAYYNIHGLAYGTRSGYMYGSWNHSGYHFNTMGGIIRDITADAGSHWGPAHEIGHQHQGPITMTGQTEVTNNLFSNMVLWFYGKTNSRLNGNETSLENVLAQYYDGTTFSSYNIWAQTYMYYKLYMYYHILGHNTKFYPRLYEMLRQDPLNGKGQQIQGAEANLKFYQKACEAAGEDLTEFFRAYGWFRVLDNYEQGDYSTSYYTQTQADIDAAIDAVKAKGYAENTAVLFINDDTTGLIGSTGNVLETYGGNTHTADLGGYDTFADNTTGSYTSSVTGNTLTLTGEGGVGILIRDTSGEVVAFSDKKTLTLSNDVMTGLANGYYSLASVDAGSGTTDIEIDIAAMTKAWLQRLITRAEAIVALKADDKPFYYRADHLTEVEAALATARSAYATEDTAKHAIGSNLLNDALKALADDEAARVPMMPGTYTLRNNLYPTFYMSINASNGLIGETENAGDAVQQWTFEGTDEADIYYIKNASTGTYVESVAQSQQVSASQTTTANAARYKVIDYGGSLVALQNQSSKENHLHCATGKNIVGWYNNAGDNATRWTLTAVELDEALADKEALRDIVTKINTLLAKMSFGLTRCMDDLQVFDEIGPFYISSNADQNVVGGSTDGGGTAALLDGNAETYFHSQWSGTAVPDDHYLQVDLGADIAFSEFLFSYATRKVANTGSTSPAPTTLVVSGSNDGATFTELATYRSTDTDNPLPPHTEAGKVWTSPRITTDTPYRYLRFTVTRSVGPGSNTQYGGHYFFAMGEFDLWGTEGTAASLDDRFAGAEAAFATADRAAFEGLMTYNNASATTAEVEAATARAQAAYDELLKLYRRGSLPVRITTDPAHPILYRIATKRDNLPAFKFDPSDSKVAVAAFALNDPQFAWYFMDGTNAGEQVLIYPYYDNNTTRVLGSNTVEAGGGKVSATDRGSEGYVQEWSFVERPLTPGYFNLTCRSADDALFYLSNWGGTSNKMGFFNGSPDSDEGSLFSFTPIRTDLPESFLQLYNHPELYAIPELTPSELTGGYSAEALETLNAAARSASDAAASFVLTDEAYDAAYDALLSAKTGYNKPETGKLYTLTSASESNRTGGTAIKGQRIYATASNEMLYDAKASTDAAALWQLTPVEGTAEGYTLTNLQTGCSLNVENTSGQTAYTLGETDAKTVTLDLLDAATRQFRLTPPNSNALNAHPNGKVVAYNAGANSSSAWVLDEAEAADIVQNVSISQYGYAGLHLNYPVEIPDGVTAYIVTQAPIRGAVTLEPLDGIIPANTGVILHSPAVEAAGTATSVPFRYAAATSAAETKDNRLMGSNYRHVVEGQPNTNYYLFGAKTLAGRTEKTVGLFLAWLQYSADGTIASGNANTDNGGWFQVSANKIYLSVPTASGTPAAQFTFTSGTPTGIAPTPAGPAATAVYDLQGRRIGRIAKPGIYVVNGKKTLVNP